MVCRILNFFFVISSLACRTWGLKYNGNEMDSPYKRLVPDPSLNMTWLRQVDHWHVPLCSKESLLLTLKLAFPPGEFTNITEPQVKRSCFLFTRIQEAPATVKYFGLNRKIFEWKVSFPPSNYGVLDFNIKGVHESSVTVVLTDSRSYFVGVYQVKDGWRAYFVATVSDFVPPSEWSKIYKKIHSIGFYRNSVSNCARGNKS